MPPFPTSAFAFDFAPATSSSACICRSRLVSIRLDSALRPSIGFQRWQLRRRLISRGFYFHRNGWAAVVIQIPSRWPSCPVNSCVPIFPVLLLLLLFSFFVLCLLLLMLLFTSSITTQRAPITPITYEPQSPPQHNVGPLKLLLLFRLANNGFAICCSTLLAYPRPATAHVGCAFWAWQMSPKPFGWVGDL